MKKSSKKQSRWTKKEERQLLAMIKEGGKKTEVFAEFAKLTNRSAGAVSFKYHAKLKNKNKPTARVKRASRTSVERKAPTQVTFSFKIDDSWQPTRIHKPSTDPFFVAVEKTATSLEPGQSFPINFSEVKRRYNWQEKSSASILRHFLKKALDSDVYNRIKIYQVKDSQNNLVQLRIRRFEEAKA